MAPVALTTAEDENKARVIIATLSLWPGLLGIRKQPLGDAGGFKVQGLRATEEHLSWAVAPGFRS